MSLFFTRRLLESLSSVMRTHLHGNSTDEQRSLMRNLFITTLGKVSLLTLTRRDQKFDGNASSIDTCLQGFRNGKLSATVIQHHRLVYSRIEDIIRVENEVSNLDALLVFSVIARMADYGYR